METINELKSEADVPVVFSDQQGLITYVNKRFETLFEWRADQIIGKPLTAIIPSYLRDAHNLGLSRFLTTGVPTLLNRPLKLKSITKNGVEFDAEHTILAERRGDQWVFAATIKPLNNIQPAKAS